MPTSPLPVIITGRRAVLVVLIFLGWQIGLAVPLDLLARVLRAAAPGSDVLSAPAQLILSNGLAAGLTLHGELRRQGQRWACLWSGPPHRLRLLGPALLLTTAAAMGSDLLSAGLTAVWPEPAFYRDLFSNLTNLAANPVASPLALIVTAAVTEELIMRGLLLRGLLRVMRPWRAIWLTALLFALLHLNPWQAPIALSLGLVFGWLFLRTGSVGLCIAGHALNNTLALLLPAWCDPPDGAPFAQFPIPLALAAAPLLLLGVWLLRRVTPPPADLIFAPAPPPLPPG